eukprot:828594_1
MGNDATAPPSIVEYCKTHVTKQEFIKELEELQQKNIRFRKIGQHYDCENHSIGLKDTAKITGSAVGYGIIGGMLGFVVGGPAGASVGYFAAGGTVGAGGIGSKIWENACKTVNSYRYYILFQYGPKLQYQSHGFSYAYYMRVEYDFDGYSIHIGNTNKYVETFGKIMREKDKKNEHNCNGNSKGVSVLIDALKWHNYKGRDNGRKEKNKETCHDITG